MQTFFPSTFFSDNRRRLREMLGSDVPIILTGNGIMQRGGDEPSPFHQDSNFWYLTGLNGADLIMVMTNKETYVIVPTRSFVREAFDGAHDIEAYAARSGIDSFLSADEGWKRLRSDLSGQTSVASLQSLPPYLEHYGIHSLPYRRRLIAKLKRLQHGVEIRDIRLELASMRSIKQAPELVALQSAIDITNDTIKELSSPDFLSTVQHEYEIEAALTYGFRRRGSEGHGFAPIVGAGKHGTTLHYIENTGPIAKNDLIVLDVGASVEHYSADITRTISKGPLSARQKDVLHAVLTVQAYALDLIKPGVLYREYEQLVEAKMGTELRKLGLITTESRDAIRHYYPHATSHFLGLDTHDAGDYHAPWEAGMVITCEPGIYIPEEGIGVRVEDDVLLTGSGNKVLSAACPQRTE